MGTFMKRAYAVLEGQQSTGESSVADVHKVGDLVNRMLVCGNFLT